MPAGMGYGPPGGDVPPEAMMAGMGAMLGGGAPPGVPGGATDLPSNEGGDDEIIATLALENVQMRELLGLGPDDPIPVPGGPEQGGPLPGPGSAPAAPGGPAPF